MRFIAAWLGQQKAVFLVEGDRARDLTAAHPAIGTDLMGLIQQPALLARLRAEGMAGQCRCLCATSAPPCPWHGPARSSVLA